MYHQTKFLFISRTSTTFAIGSATTRSGYVSRLRRAFLLRVHPDRFRAQSADVRKDQATLVQALSDRMAESDFLTFTASSSFHPNDSPSRIYQSYPFLVELKNGEFQKNSIQLNSSPQKILEIMASSIDFPPPPPPMPETAETLKRNKHQGSRSIQYSMHSMDGFANASRNDVDRLIWSAGWGAYALHRRKRQQNLDTNLLHFLQNMNPNEIKERKLNRIGASAAALVARRAFQFSAVDGTGLGWSSESLKICLQRLTSLYDEHKSKLRTDNFYPFRLVLSSDEYHQKIDLHGGVILLNPAATSLQWLDTLASVTDESKRVLKRNRQLLECNLATVEDALGAEVKKGHSCGSREYHHCMKRLANEQSAVGSEGSDESSLSVASNATVVIETEQACRRGKLRKDGNFEVGAGMSMHQIRTLLSRYANRSNELILEQTKERDESKAFANRATYEFGLQRVYKVGTAPMVSYEEMSQALAYLLNKDEEEKNAIRNLLVGQIVGITGRGQTCHVADDGSVVVPCNFC
ncbi:hypothetical protein ACHAXS_013843 [Conticribra weissflogii]